MASTCSYRLPLPQGIRRQANSTSGTCPGS